MVDALVYQANVSKAGLITDPRAYTGKQFTIKYAERCLMSEFLSNLERREVLHSAQLALESYAMFD